MASKKEPPGKRPYTLGKRLEQSDRKRLRILAAAREQLESDGYAGLTLDSLARKTALTRQTIHNLFGTKSGVIEALFDHIPACEAFGEAGDVAIVVLSRQLRGVRLDDRRRTDAAHLVRRHADAEARAADEDAALELARTDRFADLEADERVVHRLRRVRAEVDDFVPQLPQTLADPRLVHESGVVRA